MHSHVTNDETAAHAYACSMQNHPDAKNRGLLAGARSKYPYQARDFLILGIDLSPFE